MMGALVLSIFGALVLGGAGLSWAEDFKDKVRVEIESVGQHPGIDPDMYVCASGHLHIKGTVQNLADVNLGQIKVAGKALDADGKLLGTATAATKQEILAPRQKAEFNLEFLTVTGPKIDQVKKHEEQVISAPRQQ
ncbi:MAG TPA: FxLYD domain-containing protein [Methylomirabilota bacterium]|jgi:hypothetical protein